MPKEEDKWKKWYAWYPVKINYGGYVWFRYIERRFYKPVFTWRVEYRLIKKVI